MFPFSNKKGKIPARLGSLERAIRYHCNLRIYNCTGFVKILIKCLLKDKDDCFPRARQYIPHHTLFL